MSPIAVSVAKRVYNSSEVFGCDLRNQNFDCRISQLIFCHGLVLFFARDSVKTDYTQRKQIITESLENSVRNRFTFFHSKRPSSKKCELLERHTVSQNALSLTFSSGTRALSCTCHIVLRSPVRNGNCGQKSFWFDSLERVSTLLLVRNASTASVLCTGVVRGSRNDQM